MAPAASAVEGVSDRRRAGVLQQAPRRLDAATVAVASAAPEVAIWLAIFLLFALERWMAARVRR